MPLCRMQKGCCFAREFKRWIVSSSGGVSIRSPLAFLACGWRTILAVGNAVREELTEFTVAVSVFGFI